jgi:hypothetical protein
VPPFPRLLYRRSIRSAGGASIAIVLEGPRELVLSRQFGSLAGGAALAFDRAHRSAARSDDDPPVMAHEIGIDAWRDELVRRGLGGRAIRHQLASLSEYLCERDAAQREPEWQVSAAA